MFFRAIDMFIQINIVAFSVGIFILAEGLSTSDALKVRVVTWNVLDNSKMENGFSNTAIDSVLGLKDGSVDMPDLYAIGLQEQCWKCNKYNLHKIGERFQSRINENSRDIKYTVIGIEGTRMSYFCQLGCKFGTHGTTALLVIAKKNLVTSKFSFHRNDGCSGRVPENDEKGVAAMKIHLKIGKTLCFANSHLDSKKSKIRRNCLKYFFADAEKKAVWAKSCDAEFLFGDFNARTGKKNNGPTSGKYVPKNTDFTALKERDELKGTKPYGTDSSWGGNLLSYINTLQSKTFREGSIDFMPTYSIASSNRKCGGKFPCYSTNKPMSWTDRILFTKGKLLNYNAVYKEYSDHFPVFAEFLLFSQDR